MANRYPFGTKEETVECNYKGAIVNIPADLFLAMTFRTDSYEKKFIRYKDGAKMYNMSESEFYRMAHDANAIYKRNKMALVKVELIDKYLELCHI